MSKKRWWKEGYNNNYWKTWAVVVVWILIIIVGACVIVGIAIGITYCVQGCLINKGHSSPHISDGCYEYRITSMEFPRQENQTFYLKGQIEEKGDREYTIRTGNSLGEQAWSQGVGGYITVWIKNNHIIKYHIGKR